MPPMDISRNNAYDARLREILSQQHYLAGDYQQTPEMFVGGTRPTRYTSPGNTAYDSEANFATVGAGKYRSEDLVHAVDVAMTHPMARRLTGRVPKGLLELGNASNFIERERRATAPRGGRRVSGNQGPVGGVNRLKKAKRWLGFVERDIGNFVKPVVQPITQALTNRAVSSIQGGKVNRLKKAKRWLGFVERDIGNFVKPVVQPITQALTNRAVSSIQGAGKFQDFLGKLKRGYDRVPQPLKQLAEQTIMGKAVKALGGRKPSARGEIVKKVMAEHGLSLPQASKYVKEHGLYKK